MGKGGGAATESWREEWGEEEKCASTSPHFSRWLRRFSVALVSFDRDTLPKQVGACSQSMLNIMQINYMFGTDKINDF